MDGKVYVVSCLNGHEEMDGVRLKLNPDQVALLKCISDHIMLQVEPEETFKDWNCTDFDTDEII